MNSYAYANTKRKVQHHFVMVYVGDNPMWQGHVNSHPLWIRSVSNLSVPEWKELHLYLGIPEVKIPPNNVKQSY